MIAFTVLAVCAQVARNWLMLHAIGVNVSVFDAMALLIAMFTLGQLPIGPSIGPAAAVLILGAYGVAATAAAGVLLTVTGIVGSLCYAAWAITDRIVAGRLSWSRNRRRTHRRRGLQLDLTSNQAPRERRSCAAHGLVARPTDRGHPYSQSRPPSKREPARTEEVRGAAQRDVDHGLSSANSEPASRNYGKLRNCAQ